ncbi:phage tape measure protein [Thermoclostridium stercorarium subsp. stercorarium DSM 8532]|uniref:Phage tape measure protein n=1 Tax=Thermoclostridium stercorarium (strain ATCC 35414 / DSM 8532 / NCIMB 11754) TaxID=1121335 RepID=L7VL16_THES1|nr:tape measure protein [Thermoclostridium stercorarium]AGC67442.1 phage tape measure protein [Thermoclostridium stercorarium subsp. stercorarium DSM 8532]AGI38502.1 tape measure domain-containing protein [Thermoclostridium stercorarium subsp. stercorarium DSM 8532]UZQ86036.1 tape measure protein [Thermoclostridium stercorarium]
MATLKAMFKLFDGYSKTIQVINKKTDEATNKILNASGATDKFNKKLENMGASANKAGNGLGKLVKTFISLAAVKKGIEIIDNFTNTAARLNLINDGLQDQVELQNKIFAAAKRSRGAYTAMADAVAKMGLLAKDAFTSNDELIAFTELVQKSFKLGGASPSEQSSALLQLTQAMAAGRLQGDEFRSIMENAPMIADAIAKYMGKPKGELKELAAEGLITADIIKNAMFDSADDINTMFKDLPRTFGDIWTDIKNGALQAFTPVMQNINALINSPGFTQLIDSLIKGFNIVAFAVNIVIDTIREIGEMISIFWPIIEPILVAITAALTLWGVTQIPMLITKLWLMVQPILAQAAAWLAVNWPILLIGAAIGLLLYAMIKFGDTVAEVIGWIGGLFGGLFAFLYNSLAYLVNPWISFAEFLANVFNNPVYSIKKLFVDLATNVLNLVQSIASAIDKVLGTSMADSLQRLKDSMQDWLGEKPENYKEFTRMQMMDITAGVNFGYDIGKRVGSWAVEGVQNLFGKIGTLFSGVDSGLDSYMVNGALPVTGINGSKVEVDMAEEDLQYLRDIAQREYINKFTTATLAPNIQITFGDVHQEADADKVAGRIRKILQEEIAMAAEGVYS